ncbi:MAG: AAA family ATPase [Bacteroidetes bacterium]|nr:AAA family ATPase [Bacteroidota bacterium]
MDSKHIEHIKNLSYLLELERNEDYKQYNQLFLKSTIDERKKTGLTWYPVKINSNQTIYTDYLQIEIERTNSINTPHQFSAGSNIALFTTNNLNEAAQITGTIKNVSENKIQLLFHTEELPDWCYDGKLGINLQFDENSYSEMQKALQQLLNTTQTHTLALLNCFAGIAPPEFNAPLNIGPITSLNISQNKAVLKSLTAKHFSVIHGPPGTGKTTTLVQTIKTCLYSEKQILACAPTNTAVDLLTQKLLAEKINVLRIGHPARITEDILHCTLDQKIKLHPNYNELKNLKKSTQTFFELAGKYKRVFGKEEANQRAMYYAEAKKCRAEAKTIESFIIKDIIEKTQVICCTPVTSNSKLLYGKKFNTLFLDEASQTIEPMVWVALLKCNRVVLCGDHLQLPPVIKSQEAKQKGLSKTLLDVCVNYPNAVSFLNTQYRMNENIIAFSNANFYTNKLLTDSSVKTITLKPEDDSDYNLPVEFIDTAGCGFEEQQHSETLSNYNPPEAKLLLAHLTELSKWYFNSKEKNNDKISVGIISPYKEQVILLKKTIPSETKSLFYSVRVNTIDGFQGEEDDIIYLSLVRSNTKNEIGFLSDLRRMNVALTRARKKIVVIGDSATISSSTFYKNFVEYCEKNNFYKSAFEYGSFY